MILDFGYPTYLPAYPAELYTYTVSPLVRAFTETEPVRATGHGQARAFVGAVTVGVTPRGRAQGRARAVVYNYAHPIWPPIPTGTFSDVLRYYTVADTPGDVDAEPAEAVIVMRRVDQAAARGRLKRVATLSVYGTTNVKPGTKIGTVSWYVEGRLIGTNPIIAGVVFRRMGALFEVAAPIVPGKVVHAELRFTERDIELADTVFEYDYLN